MILYLNNKHSQYRMSRRYFEKKIQSLLKDLKQYNSSLGVTFVTDREIAILKGRYLGKKKATDVLSFPLEEEGCLGDIVISIDTVRKQAKELKKPVRSRIVFLIIHGLLHLLGYDHIKDKDWKKMAAQEERLSKLVGI